MTGWKGEREEWSVDNTKANTTDMSLFKIKLLITRPLIERQIFFKIGKWTRSKNRFKRTMDGRLSAFSLGGKLISRTHDGVFALPVHGDYKIEWHPNWPISFIETAH